MLENIEKYRKFESRHRSIEIEKLLFQKKKILDNNYSTSNSIIRNNKLHISNVSSSLRTEIKFFEFFLNLPLSKNAKNLSSYPVPSIKKDLQRREEEGGENTESALNLQRGAGSL